MPVRRGDITGTPFRGESAFFNAIKELVDPRPMISDAYWSATHPIDRVTGKGRAAGPQLMMYPWGAKFPPKSFVVGPPEKGLVAHRLPLDENIVLPRHLEDTMTWRGNKVRTGYYQGRPRGIPRDQWERHHYAARAHDATPRAIRVQAQHEHGVPVSYNVVDEEGKLVGATHLRLFKGATEVDEVFLKGEHRGNLEILKDMVGPALDRGVPIRAVPGNPKIGKLLQRLHESGRKAGKAPVHENWNPDRRMVALERDMAERDPANIPDRSLDLDAAARVIDTGPFPGHPGVPRVVAPPRRPPIHAARNALAEQLTRPRSVPSYQAHLDAQAAAAAYRERLLAAQRRAPNPMRISRPGGHGGV